MYINAMVYNSFLYIHTFTMQVYIFLPRLQLPKERKSRLGIIILVIRQKYIVLLPDFWQIEGREDIVCTLRVKFWLVRVFIADPARYRAIYVRAPSVVITLNK